MPVYEFRCLKCRRTIELQMSINDETAPVCCEPGCDGQQEMERIISTTSFALKGQGWAADGYSKGGGG
jgi:putative FmdB family regulatory protein